MPEEAMIKNLIGRLSPPRLLTQGLPSLRSGFVREGGEASAHLRDWSKVSSGKEKVTRSFAEVYASRAQPPRLVFFGEQHHQPFVLRAQMQALHDLVSAHPRTARIRMVMEHFSLLDQPLLDSFAAGDIDAGQLSMSYAEQSQEGFVMDKYLPLLVLARELGVRITAGFPPRQWARLAFKEGTSAVQKVESDRQDSNANPRVPPFERWDLVQNVSLAHRSYIKGLMQPDKPGVFPPLPPSEQGVTESARYPTESLRDREPQERGFEVAQALKDAFFAHSIASQLLDGSGDGAGHTVVFALCGLGHCEYGMGAVERTVEFLRASVAADAREIEPLQIASKPDDGGFWVGDAAEQDDPAEMGTRIAWSADPWSRRLADAVVLYEWQDEEES